LIVGTSVTIWLQLCGRYQVRPARGPLR
jgi:hypothetical protein